MIHIKKIALHIECTVRGSIIIERTDVNSVPDVIVKDGQPYIIADHDTNSVLYIRRNISVSDLIKTIMDLFPETTYFIAYVQS